MVAVRELVRELVREEPEARAREEPAQVGPVVAALPSAKPHILYNQFRNPQDIRRQDMFLLRRLACTSDNLRL
jgi:hypothetical protein